MSLRVRTIVASSCAFFSHYSSVCRGVVTLLRVQVIDRVSNNTIGPSSAQVAISLTDVVCVLMGRVPPESVSDVCFSCGPRAFALQGPSIALSIR